MIGVQIECGFKSYFLEEYETKVMYEDDPRCEICGAELTSSYYVVARERFCCTECATRMTLTKEINKEEEDFLEEVFMDDVEAKSYCLDEARILDAIHGFLTGTTKREPCAFRDQVERFYEMIITKKRTKTHHPSYKSLNPASTPSLDIVEIAKVITREVHPWKKDMVYTHDMYFVIDVSRREIESVMEKGFQELHAKIKDCDIQTFIDGTVDLYTKMGKELVRGMAKKDIVYFYHKPKSLKVTTVKLDTGGELYMYET